MIFKINEITLTYSHIFAIIKIQMAYQYFQTNTENNSFSKYINISLRSSIFYHYFILYGNPYYTFRKLFKLKIINQKKKPLLKYKLTMFTRWPSDKKAIVQTKQ